jgi:hypothetical protein
VSEEDRALMVRYYRCVCSGFILDWLESGMKDELSALKGDFRRLFKLKKQLYASIAADEKG